MTKFFLRSIDSNYDTLTISYASKEDEYRIVVFENDINLTKDVTLDNKVTIEGDNIVYID